VKRGAVEILIQLLVVDVYGSARVGVADDRALEKLLMLLPMRRAASLPGT
jgi:hypothetical protein